MIKLYQYPGSWKLPNASPFCLKLETYLRMAKIPYETITVNVPRKAPKGKLPYVTDGTAAIADSSLIIDYLNKKHGDILDSHLTPQERALALSIQRLVEDHLYWVVVFSRWLDGDNWPLVKKVFFRAVPFFMRGIIANMVQLRIKRDLAGQGLGRHDRDDIYHFGKQDVTALNDILADKDFMLGNTPSSVDATCYGILANIIHAPIESPLKKHTEQCENLVTYCERMYKRFYADL
tara:strand:+ start:4256 stop:4960 length:705 start_codon:yes stop_codon:yes gene_type:complete